jgi:hypothetical protein
METCGVSTSARVAHRSRDVIHSGMTARVPSGNGQMKTRSEVSAVTRSPSTVSV